MGDSPQVRPLPRARDPRGQAGLVPSVNPCQRGWVGESPGLGPGPGASASLHVSGASFVHVQLLRLSTLQPEYPSSRPGHPKCLTSNKWFRFTWPSWHCQALPLRNRNRDHTPITYKVQAPFDGVTPRTLRDIRNRLSIMGLCNKAFMAYGAAARSWGRVGHACRNGPTNRFSYSLHCSVDGVGILAL